MKLSALFNEVPLIKREYGTDTDIDYYSFNLVFWFMLELLKQDRTFFTTDFKKDTCRKIFSFLVENDVNSSTCETFAKALPNEIKILYKNKLVKVLSLLVHMVKIESTLGPELYHEIIEEEYYGLGFEILKNHPELLETHIEEIKLVFENVIINYKQYQNEIPPLVEFHPELKEIIAQHRLELKYDYYFKLIKGDIEQVNLNWFVRNQEIFRFCLDLYSKEELNNIIKRLIDLKIEYSYENKVSTWIIISLLEIEWFGNKELFHDYIPDLIELKYDQVVRDYLFPFPEKIYLYHNQDY